MADGRCEAMHVRRKTAGLMLAAAAAAGLTMAAALPASASATGYYKLLVRVGTFAPAMCLQPAHPGRSRHADLHLQRHRRAGLGDRRPRRLTRMRGLQRLART